jgi:hypothetical protein
MTIYKVVISSHGKLKNLKDEECFDRELWREKRYVFGLRRAVFTEKFH